jgi:hypothetical protein
MAPPKPNLPDSYLKWLDNIGEGTYAEFDDMEYELTPREDLLETVNVDGNEAPYIEQAKLWVATIVEMMGETETTDQDGNEIPFSRVEGFLTIGRDNEDLLCVDPADSYSVWRFFPTEGGDVEKLADSLDDWMDEVELTE